MGSYVRLLGPYIPVLYLGEVPYASSSKRCSFLLFGAHFITDHVQFFFLLGSLKKFVCIRVHEMDNFFRYFVALAIIKFIMLVPIILSSSRSHGRLSLLSEISPFSLFHTVRCGFHSQGYPFSLIGKAERASCTVFLHLLSSAISIFNLLFIAQKFLLVRSFTQTIICLVSSMSSNTKAFNLLFSCVCWYIVYFGRSFDLLSK